MSKIHTITQEALQGVFGTVIASASVVPRGQKRLWAQFYITLERWSAGFVLEVSGMLHPFSNLTAAICAYNNADFEVGQAKTSQTHAALFKRLAEAEASEKEKENLK